MVEMSNTERLNGFVDSFNEVVDHMGMTRVQQATKAGNIAQDMKSFGERIAHNIELHGSFVSAVKNCQARVAGKDDYRQAREVFATILTPIVKY